MCKRQPINTNNVHVAVAAGAFVQLQHCILPFWTDNFCSNGRKSALAFKNLLLHLTKSGGTYEQVHMKCIYLVR